MAIGASPVTPYFRPLESRTVQGTLCSKMGEEWGRHMNASAPSQKPGRLLSAGLNLTVCRSGLGHSFKENRFVQTPRRSNGKKSHHLLSAIKCIL